jgi:cysteine synthase A
MYPEPLKAYNSITELIGNTPLLRLNNLGLPPSVALYAKLEFYNPGGSVKDRSAVTMIEAAERTGALKPGSTIVEGTAGNMGLGIAIAALGRGYRVVFAVPTKFSIEKQALLRALGAEVINTPRADGMLGACKKAEELLAEIPGSMSLKQFENIHNPEAHYRFTAPEIVSALGSKVDYFVAGAGSGGTFSGIARYLKEHDITTRCVLADPLGSTLGGGRHGDYDIEGIGNDFIPATMDMSLVDKVIKVRDQDAYTTLLLLARTEGLIVGTSSGAAAWAAIELARGLALEAGESLAPGERPLNIVTVLPDRGDRYFSKGIFELQHGAGI